MLVSHGANGSAYFFAKAFGPYALPNEIIMLFPQGTEWDNSGYSGENYITKNGIQPIFFRKLIEKVTSPLDDAFDYATVPEQPDDPKAGGGAGTKPEG